ncbi:MAG: DUF1080 domain-containing protein [Planctomycetota bacterium]|nr:DUF1080 domain-containing protein [Planctomycetota bacterium]
MTRDFAYRTIFASLMLLYAAGCSKTTAKSNTSAAVSKSVSNSDSVPSSKSESEIPAEKSAAKTASAKSAVTKVEAKTTPTPTEKTSSAKLNYVPPPLTPEEIAAGWLSLFDGATLYGWTPNSETKWEVVDGVIVGSGETTGLLVSNYQLLNYEFRCDFRLEKGGNSGVFLRSDVQPKDPAIDCYELNICDSHPAFATGTLVKRMNLDEKHNVEGEWHTYHVVLEGNRLQVNLDGKPILDYTDESETPSPFGHIGLQMNGGKIEFRNVVLRPRSLKSLFNGKDLAGWNPVPGSKSVFTVADNAINLKNGAGFLETAETFDDFVLQLEARTNVDRVNSGVFFRAIKGTEAAPSNGYELQIHNGFKDGDRTQPDDYQTGWGTGSIFRRIKVRRVMSDDHKWLSMTLIANGPHFATWVNGYQVTDWTDDRKPDANPRRGKRLEAGHLSLQGHDPTTDLDFRNIRILAVPSASSTKQ